MNKWVQDLRISSISIKMMLMGAKLLLLIKEQKDNDAPMNITDSHDFVLSHGQENA